MLRELKGFGVLGGARGQPLDVAALADALAKLSRLACDHGDDIASIDINPYLLMRSGGIALDAVIVPRRPADMPPGAADVGATGNEAG